MTNNNGLICILGICLPCLAVVDVVSQRVTQHTDKNLQYRWCIERPIPKGMNFLQLWPALPSFFTS